MVDETEVIRKLTEVEARAKSNTRRIDELKPVVDEIHTMGRTLVVMCEKMEQMSKNISLLTRETEELKAAEGNRLKNVKNQIVTVLTSAFVGALAMAIIQAIKAYL